MRSRRRFCLRLSVGVICEFQAGSRSCHESSNQTCLRCYFRFNFGKGAGLITSFARRSARNFSVFFSRVAASWSMILQATELVSDAFLSAVVFVGLKNRSLFAVIRQLLHPVTTDRHPGVRLSVTTVLQRRSRWHP